MKKITTYLIAIVVLFSFVACSSRVPSPRSARGASMSYFKKYGRKYDNTQFGNKNVDNVTINAIEEIQNKVALVDAVVTFMDGHAARVLVRMQNKFPQGWKVQSWEMAGYR